MTSCVAARFATCANAARARPTSSSRRRRVTATARAANGDATSTAVEFAGEREGKAEEVESADARVGKSHRRSGSGPSFFGNAFLGVALGVAGFGRGVPSATATMESVSHASVTAAATSDSGSIQAGQSGKYSATLMPKATKSDGQRRAHPDHIGLMPNPHMEEMVCKKWFVGTMNAIG